MKKVLFTEDQMKYILGEDFTSYLDKEDNGNDFPEDSLVATGNEVLTNEPDADEFPTMDNVAASRTRSHPFYRQSMYGVMFEGKKKVIKNDKGEIVPEFCPKCGSKVGLYIQGEPVYLCSNEKCREYFGIRPFPKSLEREMKKMDKEIEKKQSLNERNHQLDGRTYRLGKNINQQIDNIAANNSGDKMINNMSNEKDATANCLYVRQNRLRQMKKDDPERYKRINGKRLEKTIGDTLNRATSETKTDSLNIQDKNALGVPNVNNGANKKNKKNSQPTIYYDTEE